MLVFMISYRDSVMHDRGKLVRNIKVVDSVLWILLKPLSQTWMYISVIDSNKLIPNRPLVFVNQTNSVPNLMKIKPFLLYKKSLPVYHQMKKKNIELGIEAILVIRLNQQNRTFVNRYGYHFVVLFIDKEEQTFTLSC